MTRFDGVVLDVDGTVLRGERALPGAPAAVRSLRAAGLATLFVTNNPTRPPASYADRLARAGVDATAEQVLTAGEVTADYLAGRHDGSALFVVGEDGLREQLRERDLRLTDDPDAADVVVASVDRKFHYDDLRDAYWALSGGDVPLVGTDPDRVVPAAERDVPGSGAIVNAVADVAECEPEAVLGKPHPATRGVALDRLGVPADRCLVVGDRPDTDIRFGADAGMTTVLVLSGVTDRAALARSDVEPDYVVDSLAAVPDLL
ncbi:HAD-IIA family hydrolase [Haloarchaeobius litoreus]|uniref:HAD-IIA family hydrolase n=1 Tax=Haloarchaeobius litoreus TaxID=755306 RepID=A0ABD6DIG7_9EURY|nr:HAD-IIA family hydrolase [Haloarchaeobius litoreus]